MRKKNKIIAFFTPFPPVVGGGERYMLTMLSILLEEGYQVELLSPFDYSELLATKFADLHLKGIHFVKTGSLYNFLPTSKKIYDYFFCLSNHIIPPCFPSGRKNYLIIQFPFPFKNDHLLNLLHSGLRDSRLKSYDAIISYSEYSRGWINQRLGKLSDNIKIHIIYPPINVKAYRSGSKSKQKYILSVGRFFEGDHNKRHIDLIRAFGVLVKNKKIKDWRYKIAGYLSEDVQSQKYFKKIRDISSGLPVDLYPNINQERLIGLYKSSSIFWHGTGYDNNELLSPEKSEHFGIAIIEAMASGNVPFVCRKGAVAEIIDDEVNGIIWNNLEELLIKSETIMLSGIRLRKFSRRAYTKSLIYDIEQFKENLHRLLTQ